jgi:hypothetical protein
MAMTAPLAGLQVPAAASGTLGGVQQQQPLQFYLQLPGAQAVQRQQGSIVRLNLWDVISLASRVQQGQQLGVVGWQGTHAAGLPG